MSDLTAKFAALEELMAAQQAETQVDLNDIRSQLTDLFNELDTVIINNAANTRALLQAISLNSPCQTCPTPPIVVPPVNTDVNPIDEDKCKRAQAFLNAMGQVFSVLDVMSAFSVPFQPNLIVDAVNQVIAALGNTDTTPVISFPESVQLVGDGINYIAGNLLVGDTLVDLFAAQYLALRDAIYSAGTPAEARAAYNAVIDDSSIPGYAKPLIKDAAYSALWSYYFDPGTTPNLAGLSGTVCGFVPGTCYSYTSTAITSDFGPATVIVDAAPLSGSVHTGYTPGQDFNGDFFGWALKCTSGDMYVLVPGLGNLHIAVGMTQGFGHTTSIFPNGVDPFTCDLCSPEA